jgi:hypothetical protein
VQKLWVETVPSLRDSLGIRGKPGLTPLG